MLDESSNKPSIEDVRMEYYAGLERTREALRALLAAPRPEQQSVRNADGVIIARSYDADPITPNPSPAWLSRNGRYPSPVYQAHYADGAVVRMSFWSNKKYPLNPLDGRRGMDQLYRKAQLVSGSVYWKGELVMIDPMMSEPQPAKQTAKPARVIVEAFRAALEAIVEAGRMSEQSRAQYCAEIAKAALAKARGE